MTASNSDQNIVVAPDTTTKQAAVPIPLALRVMRLAFQIGGRVAPKIAGRWANYLWFRPQRHVPPARELTLLANAVCIPLTHEGKRIAVYSWGSGPVILLVHGWSGRGAQLGAFVDPLVATGYRVIAFDAPAHGRSSGEDTNLPEIGEVLLELSRQQGSLHAVIAHSFGVLATLYAIDKGLKVSRVVSISPPSSIEGLVDKFAKGLSIPTAALEVMRRLFEVRFGSDAWQRFSPVRLAQATTVDALIIHDDTDREVPWQEGDALAKAWPRARMLCTSDLGHRRILRDPQVIAEAIAFVTNCSD